MPRRKSREIPLSQREIPDLVRSKSRPPICVVLGTPAEVVNLVGGIGPEDITCYQMDIYQAEKTREMLTEEGLAATVKTEPDLWDLPPEFQTAIYLPPLSGERELKIDLVDQAYHILRPGGTIVVWSPHDTDVFFPSLIKKIFGKTHVHLASDPHSTTRKHKQADTVLWAQRTGDRPRRRHEMVFQARIASASSCRFTSRPGVFSYGRLDEGARALAEVAEVHEGDRIVDIGCGTGANGVFAAIQAGPQGHVAFVDSNVRAVALAELNARANGLTSFETIASSTVAGLPERTFDVALANPPYYANSTIAQLFIERARDLLKPSGRFYLVTRQPEEVADAVLHCFGHVEGLIRRGYTILCA